MNDIESTRQQTEKVIKQISKYEFQFLKILTEAKHFDTACQRFGIARRKGFNLLKKFQDMELLSYYCYGHVGFSGISVICDIYDDVKKYISEIPAGKVKNIFTNPAVIMAYLRLRRKYHNVYPEIPLVAFIELSAVRHLFTEKWHKWYFLTCRVDFLVCALIDKPIFAVEIDGSYHSQPEIKQKDDFKERLLTGVGLSIRRIAVKDIENI
ncbi:MAG: DUF2726 domain-containing protein [Elusimicrobia bacterium]|nr:DUF2726 domain-containing protein [Elusimicrobiota bacterium]